MGELAIGAGDGSNVAPAPQHSESNAPANKPGAGELSAPLMARPEWVPEKFFKDGVINYRDMAKSYGELEKSRPTKGDALPEPKAGEPAPQAEQKAGEPTPSSVPGITPERSQYFSQEIAKDGKLSEASYTELATLGYPKAAVDAYIKGVTTDPAKVAATAVSEARIADAQIAEIKSSIGGQEALASMLHWAKGNLSAADQAAYDEAVSSNDPAKVRMAVNGLHNTYTKEVGSDPNFLDTSKGLRPAGTDGVTPFASDDEVAQAMRDPRYRADESYRRTVAERIRISDVFKNSRDYSKVQR